MKKHYLVQKKYDRASYSYYYCGSDEGLQSGAGSAYDWNDVTCEKCLKKRGAGESLTGDHNGNGK